MTRAELLADADESVRQLAATSAARDEETTGLPRPPQITINETQIETQPFNFEMNRGDEAQASPGGQGQSPPPAPTGICCVGHSCSITTEADCTGIWVEGSTCAEVKCCDPYFEVHVELVVCVTDGGGTCLQTIDLTARVSVPSVVAADGCCTDNLSGSGFATDENGNSIGLSVSNLGGGSLSWFVNVNPNCSLIVDPAFTSDTVTGDCDTGGTAVYPINNSFGGGTCDGHLYTAVGTITATWHG